MEEVRRQTILEAESPMVPLQWTKSGTTTLWTSWSMPSMPTPTPPCMALPRSEEWVRPPSGELWRTTWATSRMFCECDTSSRRPWRRRGWPSPSTCWPKWRMPLPARFISSQTKKSSRWTRRPTGAMTDGLWPTLKMFPSSTAVRTLPPPCALASWAALASPWFGSSRRASEWTQTSTWSSWSTKWSLDRGGRRRTSIRLPAGQSTCSHLQEDAGLAGGQCLWLVTTRKPGPPALLIWTPVTISYRECWKARLARHPTPLWPTWRLPWQKGARSSTLHRSRRLVWPLEDVLSVLLRLKETTLNKIMAIYPNKLCVHYCYSYLNIFSIFAILP